MHRTRTRLARSNTTHIAKLAWPILIGQLALILNGVIDTAMTSRYSATDLAALALGGAIYVSVFVGLSGVLQALSPIIGQLYGGQRMADIGYQVKQGTWLALFLSLLGCLVLLFPQPFLSVAHASPILSAKATLYLQILALALPATLGFNVYSALNTAVSKPKMVMAIKIIAVLLKFPLNALFIFGGFGIPALGGPGCAIATTVISWLMLLIAWLILRHNSFYKQFALFHSGFVKPHWHAQRALLKLGIPTGLSYFIEVTAFTFMAIFIARLGETAVAGHQITANFATVLYMLPLSIAIASGILVAQAIGAKELDQARRIGFSGIRLAAICSATIGLIIWLARATIIRAYTPNETIIAAAMPLFIFIGFYQLFDAIQCSTAFVLRAYKVAIVPTIIYAVSLWGVGLVSGYILGLNPFGISPPALHGAAGFWMGNSASIALVATSLLIYLHIVQRRAQQQQR
ncbi:MATE family efflux transporter [Glaciimonas sp. PCH181]|uniref:MATE family efflux transporter n=1 Tax=Glaciimonas sp. PCH181 TaxID=2133943 RepID=UPI000D3853A1|nr:MATE family efflux transporter [Glaciimonas sp. PCH181]PUA18256.1 MATE family efflux transporter [Glaciimonas sp. PCH181]